VRIGTPVAGRPVVLACTLNEPDSKIAALLFAAATAKELGATRVGLVAPYLAYMRQDARFQEGECVTSTHFARLISGCVDWLVTVDPHLHRRTSLDDIYTIPSIVVHAAPLLAGWIAANVSSPILVGPDRESAQWVSEVAERAGLPWIVLDKLRRGDRDVSVSLPDPERLRGRTPVLVDDMISTAGTMIAAAGRMAAASLAPPVCAGVHAVFAGSAHTDLSNAGVARIVTCNTIEHVSNGIDVSGLIAEAAGRLLNR
jgi:ribose-phosphate pyrophosphokinase